MNVMITGKFSLHCPDVIILRVFYLPRASRNLFTYHLHTVLAYSIPAIPVENFRNVKHL